MTPAPSTTRLLGSATSRFSLLSIRPKRLQIRPFSQTSSRNQDGEPSPLLKPSSLLSRLSSNAQSQPRPQAGQTLRDWAPSRGGAEPQNLAASVMSRALNKSTTLSALDGVNAKPNHDITFEEPYHFHIFSHKHNTHITVTKPNSDPILSLSAGNLGFKHSKRGTFDAAYQLAAYVLDKLHQGSWHHKMHALELVLRGFGQGREAGIKVLLGGEGRLIRPLITKVSDATRLKFGGARSRRKRRLG